VQALGPEWGGGALREEEEGTADVDRPREEERVRRMTLGFAPEWGGCALREEEEGTAGYEDPGRRRGSCVWFGRPEGG